MFKFTDIPKGDLEKIALLRQQSFSAEKNLHLAGGGTRQLSFPHKTYSMNLGDLQNAETPKAEETGIRVIEAANDNFNVIYDVNKTKEGTQPQMFEDRNFLSDYATVFSSILGSEMEEQNYEVRTLIIPALHIDALWLHKPKNSGEDKYFPVRSIGNFKGNKIYSKKEFFELLKEAVKDFDPGDDRKGG